MEFFDNLGEKCTVVSLTIHISLKRIQRLKAHTAFHRSPADYRSVKLAEITL